MIQRLKWRQVQTNVLDKALSTDHAHRLSEDDVPTWTRKSRTFTAALLYPESALPLESTGALSTDHIHGQLLVERQHPDIPRFRYDNYLLAKLSDGRVFQLGPDKDVVFGHHHDQRPAWLEKFLSTG
jgi:hypothetical protein